MFGRLAQQFHARPNRIITWKKHLLEGAAGCPGRARPGKTPVGLKTLYARIDELAWE
jgi:hypothetical protein